MNPLHPNEKCQPHVLKLRKSDPDPNHLPAIRTPVNPSMKQALWEQIAVGGQIRLHGIGGGKHCAGIPTFLLQISATPL